MMTSKKPVIATAVNGTPEVVRNGETEYMSTSGEPHTMSLTGTCLSCHSNRDTFCTACHDYANVEPTCWDCHVEGGGS